MENETKGEKDEDLAKRMMSKMVEKRGHSKGIVIENAEWLRKTA